MEVYPTIKEQIYNILRERILKRELEQGAKLNIDALAREFGVSNSPIREAINGLIKEHLVKHVPNQTPEVVRLNYKDYGQINKIIAMLLIGSFEEFQALKNRDEVIEKMEKILEVQSKELYGNDYYKFACTSQSFEDTMLFSLDNMWSKDIKSTLNDMSLMYVMAVHNKNYDVMKMKLSEHYAILDALKKNEFQKFSQLINRHFCDNDDIIGR